ncbi:MAG: Unknown protein [uncultured Sulfurovum sp.]|uniref:Uncharacterized protein n=1 Tax=uncultured Sulfurovum sp. TaxID=269237 RepID=A0A6S6TN39_9BACT|nr:MAG: Unknown protein [uncultured Sulfurovum sp.]
MSKDMDDTIKRAEETLANLDAIANQSVEDAEQKIKKGIVQTIIWIAVTIAIYFIWGTTWFFWLSFAFNVIGVAGLVFAKVMMAKAYKARSEHAAIDDEFSDYLDNDEVEDREYDEKQKVLERLLNSLAEIALENGEIYDTDCREQMSDAVFNAFIFEKKDYVTPKTFGLYDKEGNDAVYTALNTYITTMLPLAKDANDEARLDMFQDDVENEDGETPDEFFGWIDVEDLARSR